MSLKLMYITNDPQVAVTAENAGTDRIFVDLETLGKADRQRGRDTVLSHHNIDDVARLAGCLQRADLLVRVNPVHKGQSNFISSKEEIDRVIDAGADIVMLPFFHTVSEVEAFLSMVDGRVRTSLLVETPESDQSLDEILKLSGIDEIHVGLNDMSIGYRKDFMFELLTDGTVGRICRKCADAGIPYGFGGIAMPGQGMLPAEYIIREHVRLGSSVVILSRSFCDTSKITDPEERERIFYDGIRRIRETEKEAANYSDKEFLGNYREMERRIQEIKGRRKDSV